MQIVSSKFKNYIKENKLYYRAPIIFFYLRKSTRIEKCFSVKTLK